MSIAKFRRACMAAGAAACLLGLTACATLSGSTPEQVVQQRAQQRWKHLMAGQWEQAYEMVTPSYRALHDFKFYRDTFDGRARWTKADVVSVACEPEKCTAKVALTIEVPLPRRGFNTVTTHIDEVWLLEKAQWHYYEKP